MLEDDDWEDFTGLTGRSSRLDLGVVWEREVEDEEMLRVFWGYLVLWMWKWRVKQGSLFGSLSIVYVLWLWMHTKLVYFVFISELPEKKCLLYIWVKWFLALVCILGILWRKMGIFPTIDTFWVWMVALAVVAFCGHTWYFRWWKRYTASKTDCSMISTFWQEAQLMLTTGSTRLAVSRGQQTWYHFVSIATFR